MEINGDQWRLMEVNGDQKWPMEVNGDQKWSIEFKWRSVKVKEIMILLGPELLSEIRRLIILLFTFMLFFIKIRDDFRQNSADFTLFHCLQFIQNGTLIHCSNQMIFWS